MVITQDMAIIAIIFMFYIKSQFPGIFIPVILNWLLKLRLMIGILIKKQLTLYYPALTVSTTPSSGEKLSKKLWIRNQHSGDGCRPSKTKICSVCLKFYLMVLKMNLCNTKCFSQFQSSFRNYSQLTIHPSIWLILPMC